MSLFNHPVDWVGHSSYFVGYTANARKQLTVFQTSVYLQSLPSIDEEGELMPIAEDDKKRVLILPVPNKRDEDKNEEGKEKGKEKENEIVNRSEDKDKNEEEKEEKEEGKGKEKINERENKRKKEKKVEDKEGLHKTAHKIKNSVQLVDLCGFYPDFFPDCMDAFNVCKDERKKCYDKDMQKETEVQEWMDRLIEARKAKDNNKNKQDKEKEKENEEEIEKEKEEEAKRRRKFEVVTTYLSHSRSSMDAPAFPLPIETHPLRRNEVFDASSEVWVIEDLAKLLKLAGEGEEEGRIELLDVFGRKPCKFSMSQQTRDTLVKHYSEGFSFILCKLSSRMREEQIQREAARKQTIERMKEEMRAKKEKDKRQHDLAEEARRKFEEQLQQDSIALNPIYSVPKSPKESEGEATKWDKPLVQTVLDAPEEKGVLIMLPAPLLPQKSDSSSSLLIDLDFYNSPPHSGGPSRSATPPPAAVSLAQNSNSLLAPTTAVAVDGLNLAKEEEGDEEERQRRLERKISEFWNKEKEAEQRKDKGKEKEDEHEDKEKEKEKESSSETEYEREGEDIPAILPDHIANATMIRKCNPLFEGSKRVVPRYLERVHILLAYTHPVVGGKLFVPLLRPNDNTYNMHNNHNHNAQQQQHLNHTIISVNTQEGHGGPSLDVLMRIHYEKQGRQRRQQREDEEMEKEREDSSSEDDEREEQEDKEGKGRRRRKGDKEEEDERGEDLLLGLGKPNIKPDDPAWQHLNNLVQLFQCGLITEQEMNIRKKQIIDNLTSTSAVGAGSAPNANALAATNGHAQPIKTAQSRAAPRERRKRKVTRKKKLARQIRESQSDSNFWRELQMKKLLPNKLPLSLMPIYEIRRKILIGEGKNANLYLSMSPANKLFNDLRMEKLYQKKRGRTVKSSRLEDWCLDILDLQKDHVSTLRAYAQYLYQKKRDMKKANRYFNLALKANPLHRLTLCKYAIFLDTMLMDEAKAHRYFKRALCVDPNSAKLLCDYAVFLYNVLRINNAAEQVFKRALEVDGGHVDSLGCYAMFVEREKGDLKKAHELYLAALKRADETGYGLVHWLERYEVFIRNHGFASRIKFSIPAKITSIVERRIEKRMRALDESLARQKEDELHYAAAIPASIAVAKGRPDAMNAYEGGLNSVMVSSSAASVLEESTEQRRKRIEDRITKQIKEENEEMELRQLEQSIKKKVKREMRKKKKEKEKQSKMLYKLGLISLEEKNFIGQVIEILFRKCVMGPNASSHKIALFHRETEKKLLELQSPNNNTLEYMEELLHRPMGRTEFLATLNAKRQRSLLLDRGAFFILCRLMWVALEAADDDGDWKSARDLMVLSSTFYTKAESTAQNSSSSLSARVSPFSSKQHSSTSSNASTAGGASSYLSSSAAAGGGGEDRAMYLQEYLKEASIWRNEDYWSAIFIDMVCQEKSKLKRLHSEESAGLISEQEKNRRKKQEQNITFALLGSFSQTMISTGVSPDVVDKFVAKQCQLNNFDEKTTALLKADVWNAFKF